jgi:type I site-specific restriction-modification system R (restriction) subunit
MSVDLSGLPGDLILFSPHKKNINIIAQSLLRLKKAKYSHVAIVVEPFNAIHAMPKLGVHAETIRNILKYAQGDFVVYRNASIQTEETLLKLQDSLNSHRGQFYNYGIGVRNSWNSSFCSELAALAFEKIGIKLSSKSPNKTLPSDIYDTVNTSSNWIAITEEFKKDYLGSSYEEVYDKLAKLHTVIENLNQDMSFGQKILTDRINAASACSAAPTNYKPVRDYWTNDLGDKFSWVIFFSFLGYKFRIVVRRLISYFKGDSHNNKNDN